MNTKFDTSVLADYADGTKSPMARSANIATYPPRAESLQATIDSIYDQVDIIRIYFNEYNRLPNIFDPDNKISKIKGKNLTDNGKFFGLDLLEGPEYYFTMDDDIIYPQDYVDKSVKAINTYGCIITYHGRRLLGLGKKYYSGHKSYQCLNSVVGNFTIDVPGTGVTAFSTAYFHPKNLSKSPFLLMSDLVFAHSAASHRRRIGIINHDAGWIKHTENEESIYETEVQTECKNQNSLADKIYMMNHEG